MEGQLEATASQKAASETPGPLSMLSGSSKCRQLVSSYGWGPPNVEL